MAPVSSCVYRFEGKRRPVWRARYRLPDGRQVKKTIGPAWTERGRPAAGYFTKRSDQDADVATTMKYLHYDERPGEAEHVAAAFAVETPASGPRSPHTVRPP